jgi:hypothetical protein
MLEDGYIAVVRVAEISGLHASTVWRYAQQLPPGARQKVGQRLYVHAETLARTLPPTLARAVRGLMADGLNS